jgi:two-component system chemotaxis response regulator CheY
MPVMDGIKFVETVSASPEYKHIPVVIVSTEGSTTRIDNLIKKGVKGYLRKPFTPEKIRDIIITTLGEWK